MSKQILTFGFVASLWVVLDAQAATPGSLTACLDGCAAKYQPVCRCEWYKPEPDDPPGLACKMCPDSNAEKRLDCMQVCADKGLACLRCCHLKLPQATHEHCQAACNANLQAYVCK